MLSLFHLQDLRWYDPKNTNKRYAGLGCPEANHPIFCG
jgi:hypothetical protein